MQHPSLVMPTASVLTFNKVVSQPIFERGTKRAYVTAHIVCLLECLLDFVMVG